MHSTGSCIKTIPIPSASIVLDASPCRSWRPSLRPSLLLHWLTSASVLSVSMNCENFAEGKRIDIHKNHPKVKWKDHGQILNRIERSHYVIKHPRLTLVAYCPSMSRRSDSGLAGLWR